MIFGYIGEVVWILAKCYVSYRIVKTISKERFNNWITAVVWAFFSAAAAGFLLFSLYKTNLVGNVFPTTVICVGLTVLSIILFKSEFIPKIVGISILFELDDLLDYFCQTVLYCFLDTAGEGTPRLFQITGIPRGILLLVYSAGLLVFGKKLADSYRKHILPIWIASWKGLILIPVIWFINRFFQRVYYKSENLVTNSYFFTWMLLLFIVLVASGLVWILQRRIKKAAEETVQKVRFEALQQEAKKTIETGQKQQKLVHDIKGNLAILKRYLDNGDIVNARAFLNEVLPEDAGSHIYHWSEYEILDMIISIRVEEAEKAGIHCDIFCETIHDLALQDVEVCSLFGNLFTNAIEAQSGNFSHEKWIKLNIRQQKDTLYAEISNPFEHKILYNNGRIRTSKKDSVLHGMGLSVVEQIVNKYNGEMDISTENQVFRVRIMTKSSVTEKKKRT